MTSLTTDSIAIEVRGLAPRQAEAVAHMVAGLSSKQTAQAMNISHRTVEVFLYQAMLRFGARNRALLIAHAVAKGALVITEHTRALILALVFALAIAPSLEFSEDYARLAARHIRIVRVRRGSRKEEPVITNLLEV